MPLDSGHGPTPSHLDPQLKAKNLLKAELKRRGVTYAALAEKLAEIGVAETERNLNNKISRGGFTAAFLLQCLEATGCRSQGCLVGRFSGGFGIPSGADM